MFIENESNPEFYYFYTVSEHVHFQCLLKMNPIQNSSTFKQYKVSILSAFSMFIENESNLEFFYFYTVSEHFHFHCLLKINLIQNSTTFTQ